MLVDPTGMSASPIYGYDGNFLGTDEEGFSGDIIVMDQEEFEVAGGQGMSHESALYYGNKLGELSESTLSLDAYANIWNDVLSKVAGVDMSVLQNNSVSIFTGGYSIDFNNDPNGEYVYSGFNNPSNATGAYATVPCTDDKITINFEYRKLLRTVENAQNTLGEHEYNGHIVNDFDDDKTHPIVYQMQINSPSWEKTTSDYKKAILDSYKVVLNRSKK